MFIHDDAAKLAIKSLRLSENRDEPNLNGFIDSVFINDCLLLKEDFMNMILSTKSNSLWIFDP